MTTAAAMSRTGAPRIVIAGGGYVGLYAALRLERLLAAGEADIVLVNPENYMVYQPLLPEVASGSLEARHAVVPLRKALRRTQLVTGRVLEANLDERTVRVRPHSGEAYDLAFDHLVVGLGSVTRMLPIPGLEDHAVGFATLEEAIHLRNHVLARMEAAEAGVDAEARRRALTFTFVGGGYTGVEALAELEDMARSSCELFPTISPNELRFVLIEATDRILPTVAPELSEHALQVLRARGIEVRLETTLEEVDGSRMTLSDGDELDSDTLVWMAGVQPNLVISEMGLPVDDAGRLVVDRTLTVEGLEGVWGGGDNAAVPDGEGGHFPPTAQHAHREGRHIAENITAELRGQQTAPFAYSSPGEMITLGRHKGVGTLYGRQLTGVTIWLLRRLYYAAQIPTINRKVRILLDWAVGLPFKREVVSLGSLEEPREPIEEAADQAERSSDAA